VAANCHNKGLNVIVIRCTYIDVHSYMQCQCIKPNSLAIFQKEKKKKANLLMYKGYEVIAEEPKEYSAVKLHC
jgi:hypothetical protein